jgi:hypothetical protein
MNYGTMDWSDTTMLFIVIGRRRTWLVGCNACAKGQIDRTMECNVREAMMGVQMKRESRQTVF